MTSKRYARRYSAQRVRDIRVAWRFLYRMTRRLGVALPPLYVSYRGAELPMHPCPYKGRRKPQGPR